jgi:type IV pilus assembly protein PilC
MAKFPVFDQKMVSLIKVAEEVNQLSEMFQKLSTQYSSDVDHRTGTLGSVMEPVLMILIGGIVGFILIALYLPMFNLGGTIK